MKPEAAGGRLWPRSRTWRRNISREPSSHHAGNRSAAAKTLGIDRKTLWRKIQVYGLDDGRSSL